MIEAAIKGLLAADFSGAEAPPMVFKGVRAAPYRRDHIVGVRDARALQGGAASESGFFAEHSFVLLPHRTAVKDWEADVGPVYRPEIDKIVRERLLPERRVHTMQAPNAVQRGGPTRLYGEGVHSDGPLTPDVYASNLGKFANPRVERNWRLNYARPEIAGFMLVNFWRPILMREPVRHFPLALCEPDSVEDADRFPVTIPGLAPGRTTHHLALRYNPGQNWYYYPSMAVDEVLVFKLCEFWKDDPDAPPQNVFHTAFHDPTAPADAERRKSCEHRVGVMILRD